MSQTKPERILVTGGSGFLGSHVADELVKQYYGPRRFPGVVFGDSTKTIPALLHRHPSASSSDEEIAPLRCDVGFIDGAKTFAGRLAHIRSMRSVSAPGTRVFLDEVTTRECVDGSLGDGALHAERCKNLHQGYYDSTRAYSHAAARGLMRVLECDWPPRDFNGTDGVCMAELL